MPTTQPPAGGPTLLPGRHSGGEGRRTSRASVTEGTARIFCTTDASISPSRPSKRERFGAVHGSAAAQGEGGDVDANIAQRGADFADYAGDVDVAREQQRAFERGLQADTVEREDSRRAVLPDRSLDR